MPRNQFVLKSEFQPMGDQPAAIDSLVRGIHEGRKYQCLLGATGTGKTFTMANTIARVNKPTLIISHNKTLAAQLYEEMKELFPDNAVNYFVSYYDYYQPEAYIPQRDIYIEKDSQRNDDLDRLRLAATSNLVSRRDVIIVASVSCIFGLGSPDAYKKSVISVTKGQRISRQDLLRGLSDLQYTRNEYDLKRGTFRVRGDVIELHQASEEMAWRIELFGDEVDNLQMFHPTTGELLKQEDALFIYPAVHYMVEENTKERALAQIQEDLDRQVMHLRSEGKLLEAQRLLARTKYDLEMIQEVGFCNGIENYSRYFDGRPPGSKPYTLMDYFPDAASGEYVGEYAYRTPEDPSHHGTDLQADVARNEGERDWLLIIDESHVTIPQMHAMYHGDRNRKLVLVDHGFRLPAAMDNRPLKFEEIEKLWPQVLFVSATPGPYELQKTEGVIVEQVIRPTGLVDPQIEVRPAQGQVPDLLNLIRERIASGERTIVTTLTKRLAEDLAAYLASEEINTRYIHSDVETLDRVTILRELREGQFDVIVGVNLLREGLDLPEVSLVAIMDADKAGFLRSPTSLIQQIGRAARNVNAMVILYADSVTPAMRAAMEETDRRRAKQVAYNQAHGITPQTVKKAIRMGIELELRARKTAAAAASFEDEVEFDRAEVLAELEAKMLEAAQNMEFEKAANLRDRIKQLKSTPLMGKIKKSELEGAGDGEDRDRAKPKPGMPGVKRSKRGRKSSNARQ